MDFHKYKILGSADPEIRTLAPSLDPNFYACYLNPGNINCGSMDLKNQAPPQHKRTEANRSNKMMSQLWKKHTHFQCLSTVLEWLLILKKLCMDHKVVHLYQLVLQQKTLATTVSTYLLITLVRKHVFVSSSHKQAHPCNPDKWDFSS